MHPRLSARQEQCLRLTAFRTDKEIAAHLGISEATVKKHVHEACQKLGVNRRKAALALLDPIVPDPGPVAHGDVAGGYPKHPMAAAAPVAHALAGDDRGESEADEQERDATRVGRTAGRPAGESAAGSAGGVISTSARNAGGDEAGDGSARLGYGVPPRSAFLRIVLIVALTVILAAMVVTTVVMLGEMHEAVGKIDAVAYPRKAAGKTS
jgi:DNA-binding CsgD family transcriptional regulator